MSSFEWIFMDTDIRISSEKRMLKFILISYVHDTNRM